MRRTLLFTAAAGAALLSCAPRTTPQATSPQRGNLGTPMTQPQPGGGVSAGSGAPTSALPAAPGPALTGVPAQRRGPPSPGSAAPPRQGGVTGSSQLGATGAVRPGAQGAQPGTGGSQATSSP